MKHTRHAFASLALAAALLALTACTAGNPSGGDKTAAAKDRMTLVYYNIPG